MQRGKASSSAWPIKMLDAGGGDGLGVVVYGRGQLWVRTKRNCSGVCVIRTTWLALMLFPFLRRGFAAVV